MMTTLRVRDVPEELYEKIQALARSANRSVSAEVVTLLDQAVRAEELRRRQGEILASIRRRRAAPTAGTPNAVELLREDRAR